MDFNPAKYCDLKFIEIITRQPAKGIDYLELRIKRNSQSEAIKKWFNSKIMGVENQPANNKLQKK